MPKTNFYRVGPEQLSDHAKWEFNDYGFEWIAYWYDSTKLGHNQAGLAVGLYYASESEQKTLGKAAVELYIKELDVETEFMILDDCIEYGKIFRMTVEDFWKEKHKFHQFNDWPQVKEMVEALLREQQRIDHKKFINAPTEAWAL